MKIKEQTITLYQYFSCKIMRNSSFVFYPTQKQEKQIDNFLDLLHKKYGKHSFSFDKLYEYFLYQFNYWHDKDTRFGRGNIMFDWVIGKKAFERYEEAIENKSIYYSTDILDKYFISKDDVVEIVDFENKPTIFNLEEVERQRYLNSDYGLFHCLSLTSGYTEKSEFCKICSNKFECQLNGDR